MLDFIDTTLLTRRTSPIYITEQTTPLFRAVKRRYPDAIGSEFLRDGTASGQRNGKGILHQDLTALSFGDETLEIICAADVLEHVADYRAALAECFRCLRVGGSLVITVPFLLNAPETLVRATVENDGAITHHLPAEYHGDPLDKQGILCYYHFGWDFLGALSDAGLRDRSAFLYWSCKRGYLGSPQILICATKNREHSGANLATMADPVSSYYDAAAIAQHVASGRHRDSVGGMWDEIGRLQFNFLASQGLLPRHKLVDVGCGCLRGGIHFVEYLEPGNYYGIDMNQSLLDAGYDVELAALGLQAKLPKENLVCTGAFEFATLGTDFDFAVAQSLFTHLPSNHIRLSLTRLAPKMVPSGRLYATFFIVPDDHPYGDPYAHAEGVVTNDHCDPYHYRYADIVEMCEALPWRPILIGEWGHPRGQQMVAFELDPQLRDDSRALDLEAASALPPGAAHYRAYVGPPDRYDFLSASQFALLFAFGLRDRDRVLDIGCGSLRLGRLLIPFLRAGHYYGLEPNSWLIADAIRYELGASILDVKRPAFRYSDDFCLTGFNAKFKYIVAQSILTHCGTELTTKIACEMAQCLEPDGRILFSIIEAPEDFAEPESQGWHYPDCVAYGRLAISRIFEAAGLRCQRLPWYHPGAQWYAAAFDELQLPSGTDLQLLRGAVLFDEQFAASTAWPS